MKQASSVSMLGSTRANPDADVVVKQLIDWANDHGGKDNSYNYYNNSLHGHVRGMVHELGIKFAWQIDTKEFVRIVLALYGSI